jgi:hypothetical protein
MFEPNLAIAQVIIPHLEEALVLHRAWTPLPSAMKRLPPMGQRLGIAFAKQLDVIELEAGGGGEGAHVLDGRKHATRKYIALYKIWPSPISFEALWFNRDDLQDSGPTRAQAAVQAIKV